MSTDADQGGGARCSQCDEPAIAQPPTAQPWTQTWTGTGRDLPQWSHTDGEPLCPVVGEHGYEPAPAVITAETGDDDGWEP